MERELIFGIDRSKGVGQSLQSNMIENWDNDDYERPFEEYPAGLGYTWDGELQLGPHLAPLDKFDWSGYMDLVEIEVNPGVRVELASGHVDIKFEYGDDLAIFLDYLPSVTVFRDTGNPDGGPASGAGYVFFLAEDATLEGLEVEIRALLDALNADLATLKSKSKN